MDATVIRGLLRNFIISSLFSNTCTNSPSVGFVSVANLLFTDVDIFRRRWLHKNKFCVKMWPQWTYHQSTYCPCTSFLFLFIYCFYIYVVLSVWYCLIEYIFYLFLLCCSFALALKYLHVLFNLNVNKYLKELYFTLMMIIIIIIIIICLLYYVSRGKNYMPKTLKKFIYIYTHTRTIYVEYPWAIFNLGHCTVLIFWSRLKSSHYQCHNLM